MHPVRLYCARQLLDTGKFLYDHGALSHEEMQRMGRRLREMSKKQRKEYQRQRDFIKQELDILRLATVNGQSSETMQTGAPDTYLTVKTYLERRLHDVATLEASLQPVKSKLKKKKPKVAD